MAKNRVFILLILKYWVIPLLFFPFILLKLYETPPYPYSILWWFG